MGTVSLLVSLCREVATSLFLPTAFGYMSKQLAVVESGDSRMVVHPAADQVNIESFPAQEDFPEGGRDLADLEPSATCGPSR